MKRDSPVAARFYPQALSIYGNWLADTRSENPNVIMENYLEKVPYQLDFNRNLGGARWLSGSVRLEVEGLLVQDSLEALMGESFQD